MEPITQKKENTFFDDFAARMGVNVDLLNRFVLEYNNLQIIYRSAIREVSTRLEVLDDEFSFRHKRNPIHSIQTRLKTPRSIMEKMGRKGLVPSIRLIREELTDVAGIRVICPYVEDIYRMSDLLCAQNGVECIEKKDFIMAPKESGYRSLHLVVTVPVRFSDGEQQVPVEVQIRTIAMDFWASLEHELRYKSDTELTRDVTKELKDMAETISQLDTRMQEVYGKIGTIENKSSNL